MKRIQKHSKSQQALDKPKTKSATPGRIPKKGQRLQGKQKTEEEVREERELQK